MIIITYHLLALVQNQDHCLALLNTFEEHITADWQFLSGARYFISSHYPASSKNSISGVTMADIGWCTVLDL